MVWDGMGMYFPTERFPYNWVSFLHITFSRWGSLRELKPMDWEGTSVGNYRCSVIFPWRCEVPGHFPYQSTAHKNLDVLKVRQVGRQSPASQKTEHVPLRGGGSWLAAGHKTSTKDPYIWQKKNPDWSIQYGLEWKRRSLFHPLTFWIPDQDLSHICSHIPFFISNILTLVPRAVWHAMFPKHHPGHPKS